MKSKTLSLLACALALSYCLLYTYTAHYLYVHQAFEQTQQELIHGSIQPQPFDKKKKNDGSPKPPTMRGESTTKLVNDKQQSNGKDEQPKLLPQSQNDMTKLVNDQHQSKGKDEQPNLPTHSQNDTTELVNDQQQSKDKDEQPELPTQNQNDTTKLVNDPPQQSKDKDEQEKREKRRKERRRRKRREQQKQQKEREPQKTGKEREQPNTAKFWRYDDAGPTIVRGTTHFLSSIPQKHRLSIPTNGQAYDTDAAVEGFFATIQANYSSNPENVFPQKLHLVEMNPSIVQLPEDYRTHWRDLFGKAPYYVASYRVTHETNCYDTNTTFKLWGDSWQNRGNATTNFLGISLLDENLTILLDTTVDVSKNEVFKEKATGDEDYNDYRLFNLGDRLYLSTVYYIVPIHLSVVTTNLGPEIPRKFQEIPFAFHEKDKSPTLKVWMRRFASCPPGSLRWRLFKSGEIKSIESKNLLYFGMNHTDNTAKVMLYPKHNPNPVQSIDLTKKCRKDAKDSNSSSLFLEAGPVQPRPTFETIEALKYPKKKLEHLFMTDRGSACCTTISAKTILPIPNTTMEEGPNDDDEELLVAVVHPKTKFPGKRLPKGVAPNTYLSRFVAILPREPYTIVAKSGMFCLGYPRKNVEETGGKNPLEFVQMNRLFFGDEAYDCPRIHFITGMVDAPPSKNTNSSDSVIVSYGVSDCLSRFVEIPKSEIIRMLSPGATSLPE